MKEFTQSFKNASCGSLLSSPSGRNTRSFGSLLDSSGSSNQSKRTLASPIIPGARDKLVTLKAVLNNELDSPYSLADFDRFLRDCEHSEENLEFLLAVKAYKLQYEELRNNMVQLVKTFVVSGSEKEINCPVKLRRGATDLIIDQGSCDISALADLEHHVVELMRLSSFPHFLKSLTGDASSLQSSLNASSLDSSWNNNANKSSPSKANAHKHVTLAAILNNQLEEPYSLANFESYLRDREHSEENFEFLMAVKAYRNAIVANSWDVQNSRAARQMMTSLIRTYVVSGAQKEINCPIKLRRKTINEITNNENFSCAILDELEHHIKELMRLSSLPNFLNTISSNKGEKLGESR